MRIVEKIADKCIEKQIITPDQKEWFRYGIERRLSTILIAIPFLILAIILSNVWTSISFLVSFFLLRSRTNGLHAKTALQCLVASVFLELIFLGLLYPNLNELMIGVIMLFGVIIVFVLAPYDHPAMNFTAAELAACKKSARIRMCVLVGITALAMLVKLNQIVKGVALGCAMASLLLCFAYIFDRRNKNGEQENRCQQAPQ